MLTGCILHYKHDHTQCDYNEVRLFHHGTKLVTVLSPADVTFYNKPSSSRTTNSTCKLQKDSVHHNQRNIVGALRYCCSEFIFVYISNRGTTTLQSSHLVTTTVQLAHSSSIGVTEKHYKQRSLHREMNKMADKINITFQRQLLR